jgi:hypothetical protein
MSKKNIKANMKYGPTTQTESDPWAFFFTILNLLLYSDWSLIFTLKQFHILFFLNQALRLLQFSGQNSIHRLILKMKYFPPNANPYQL